MQQEGRREAGRRWARWKDEVGKDRNVGNAELVGNSHESRGVEEATDGDQDSFMSCRVNDNDKKTLNYESFGIEKGLAMLLIVS